MKTTEASVQDWIANLPKVELHLHLEGAIPWPALWELIRKYGGDPEISEASALEQKFRYRDFPHFIETWRWKNGFLREYEDFTHIASSVAEDLARQNIRYVEAFYSPGDFAHHGLDAQRLTEAIRDGLRTQEDRIRVHLIADLVRDYGPEQGMKWLHEISEVQSLGVIGIGIGGSEQKFPPEPYREVYEEARRSGLRTMAHAGEAAGAGSIWGAIRTLKVDRIGHGTRAIEDPNLVQYLKENQTPIEMCPVSNLRTGVIARLEDHPIQRFYEEGLLVSVHTDDPKMFNTTLAAEYQALADQLRLSPEDIVRLVENAIRSAWCDDKTVNALTEELRKAALPGPSRPPGEGIQRR
ncbi:MAG: adenosine deaminase [Acidobacteriota bacterium]